VVNWDKTVNVSDAVSPYTDRICEM